MTMRKPKKPSITDSITENQKKQIIRLCKEMMSKAAKEVVEDTLLTCELAQRILISPRGDKLQADLKLVIRQFICEISIDLYKEERVNT